MWGAEDLAAGLGGKSSRFGAGRRTRHVPRVMRWVRSATRLAAAAYGKFAVDSVHLDIDDVEGLVDGSGTPSRSATPRPRASIRPR